MKSESPIIRALRTIRWPSVLVSSVIWLALPLVMHAIDGNQAPTKWSFFWQSLPWFLGYYITAFFVVATVMHYRFASAVCALRGWRFWLYPLGSLPLAASLYFVLSMVFGVITDHSWARALSPVGIVNIFYYWFLVLVVVMGSMIWVSYPLAILNQIVIRYFYSGSSRASK